MPFGPVGAMRFVQWHARQREYVHAGSKMRDFD
jgi:hypothetical protein